MRAERRRLTGFIVLAILVLILVWGVMLLAGVFDPEYETSAVDTQPPSQEVIARGKYLSRAGDCAACHTSDGGAPFAGGVPIPTPFGVIHGTNITPDEDHGIGGWTSAQFYRAVRDGIAPDHPLYPAMPYTSYHDMAREDSDAIFAYLKSITPVAQANEKNGLPFPFNLRFLMRGWNFLFVPDSLPAVTEGSSEQWVRGRYLTNVLGHCAECHTPRGMLGQLKLGESFKGGQTADIWAPDITAAELAARGWSPEDLQRFMRKGIAPQGSAYGDMYTAFHHSTRYLTAEDNKAMVTYLTGDRPLAPQALPGAPAATETDEEIRAGRGQYLALCAGCHAVDGGGKPNVTVALKGNSTVRNADPHNLIVVILRGLSAKDFPGNQGRQSMPGFAGELDDGQLALLANFLRSTWGGQAADVQAADVAALRR